MTKLTLTNDVQTNTTVLENEFIDQYMVKANGEYVKVYLLLLRYLGDPAGIPAISQIADMLDYTEKDVIRALNYWKKQGLLDYEVRTDAPPADKPVTAEPVVEIPAADESAADEPAMEIPHIEQFRSRKEFKELLFVAEQYLGKTLSSTEMKIITYLYEALQMSAELIEYLIEYCVENNHKSIHYIQKVALSWHEQNITTVEQAKCNALLYSKNCYSVLNAYGIKGRAPAASEITYIRRWNEEYCFSLEVILEACSRTMNAIHQPSFDYTESILKNWHNKGVHNLKDVAAIDAAYLKGKEQRLNAKKSSSGEKQKQPSAKKASNKFNNFDSRSYDMNDLERKLIQQ